MILRAFENRLRAGLV